MWGDEGLWGSEGPVWASLRVTRLSDETPYVKWQHKEVLSAQVLRKHSFPPLPSLLGSHGLDNTGGNSDTSWAKV